MEHPPAPLDPLNPEGAAFCHTNSSDELRLRTLELNMVRLESGLESLSKSVQLQHATLQQTRVDDRAAMNELGKRLEMSINHMASEVTALAKQSVGQDADFSRKQAYSSGALDTAKWIVATALTVSALAIGLFGARNAIQNRPAPRAAPPTAAGPDAAGALR